MLVREIMTTPAVHIGEKTSPQAAVRLMARAHVTSLPVVDAEGRVVGIVSEADILRRSIQPDPRGHLRPTRRAGEALPETVESLMTREPYVTRAEEDVADVVAVLAAHGWKSVPVVKGHRLVGMLSRSDVIRCLSRPDDEIAHDVTRVFARYGSPRWQISVREGIVTVSATKGENERALADALAAEITGVRAVCHDPLPSAAET
jgi:CBS domain-containing protein